MQERVKPSASALGVLLRVAILGVTQGVGTLLAVMLFLMRCGPDLILAVLLVCALAGLVLGQCLTTPARRGEG